MYNLALSISEGNQEPLKLFEGHDFHRQISGERKVVETRSFHRYTPLKDFTYVRNNYGLFVCLSIRLHISKTTQPNFTNFFVHVACNRGSVLLWRHCDMLCTSGFVVDVMFLHNGPYDASCVFISGKSVTAEAILHRF